MRFILLALAVLLSPLAVHASEGDTQALIDELRALSDRARELRAADRWLQRALDDLVARYDWPWRKELVFDDFADGDYQQHPSWRVHSGRFWVARGRGLRTRADAVAGPADAPSPSVEEALIGALLQHALREGGAEDGGGQAVPALQASEISLAAAITNAFAVEADFVLESPDGPGQFAIAVLQGDSGRYGYRLLLRSGGNGFVGLERVRGGRAGIVEQARLPFDPGDGAQHRLGWRQAGNGDVTVELDGDGLFSVRDKAFRDGYQQLVLTLSAGDLTLNTIRVSGTD